MQDENKSIMQDEVKSIIQQEVSKCTTDFLAKIEKQITPYKVIKVSTKPDNANSISFDCCLDKQDDHFQYFPEQVSRSAPNDYPFVMRCMTFNLQASEIKEKLWNHLKRAIIICSSEILLNQKFFHEEVYLYLNIDCSSVPKEPENMWVNIKFYWDWKKPL